MKITRTSTLTGVTRTRDIEVTEKQLQAHAQGMLIQNAMPDIKPRLRSGLLFEIVFDMC